jgi:bifunctional ADP-heptose synthase (sugar kinase/adenylyltransferase)
VTALAAGADFLEAMELANLAAGVVVGKLGTASCTPDELLNHMKGLGK